MKSKRQKKQAVTAKINHFFNENLGLSIPKGQGRLKAEVLFSLPTGSFIQDALDFRLSDPEITEITLWKVSSGKSSK
jgi:hypothetical protein